MRLYVLTRSTRRWIDDDTSGYPQTQSLYTTPFTRGNTLPQCLTYTTLLKLYTRDSILVCNDSPLLVDYVIKERFSATSVEITVTEVVTNIDMLFRYAVYGYVDSHHRYLYQAMLRLKFHQMILSSILIFFVYCSFVILMYLELFYAVTTLTRQEYSVSHFFNVA